MKAKDLIIDFINQVFLFVLIGYVLLYIIAGDRFNTFVEIMKALFPISIFGIIFLVMLKIKRTQEKERRNERSGQGNDNELVLYLNNFDRLKGDILIFLTPIVILLAAFFIDKEVTKTDVIQASLVFLLMYAWQKLLYTRRRE